MPYMPSNNEEQNIPGIPFHQLRNRFHLSHLPKLDLRHVSSTYQEQKLSDINFQ